MSLHDVKVVELGATLASRLLAELLEEQGATVTRVPLEGISMWHNPSWDDGRRIPKLVTSSVTGHQRLDGLLGGADVVVSSLGVVASEAAGVHFDRVRNLSPDVVYCAIDPFPVGSPSVQAGSVDPRPVGSPGVRNGWLGPVTPDDQEWVVAAALGLHRVGDDPLAEPVPFASAYGAAMAAVDILGALLVRRPGGPPTHLRCSLFSAGLLALSGRLFRARDKDGADLPSPHGTLPAIAHIYPCLDGRFIQPNGRVPRVVEGVLRSIGLDEWVDMAVDSLSGRVSAGDNELMRRAIANAFLGTPAAVWERYVAEHGGAATMCRTTEEWLAHPQAAATGIVAGGGRGNAVNVVPASTAAGQAPPAADVDPFARPAPRPLDGVRVLDLTAVVAGPTCGRLLAELGADVIKVDAPARAVRPLIQPTDWLQVNHGKRSLLLDLGAPEGREVLATLLAQADVLLENFRSGVLARLGFDADEVFRVAPSIVYASLDAYDFGGDMDERPGWDSNAQALTGMQDVRASEDVPRRVDLPLNDYATGMLGCFGILAALRGVRADGIGRRVTGSLARTATFLQAPNLFWARDVRPSEGEHVLSMIECRDGWVVARCDAARAEAGRGGSVEDAMTGLAGEAIPSARVVPHAELHDAGWLRTLGLLSTAPNHNFGETDNVFAWNQCAAFGRSVGGSAPDPGEHSVEVLRDAGLDRERIDGLVASGVVGEHRPLPW